MKDKNEINIPLSVGLLIVLVFAVCFYLGVVEIGVLMGAVKSPW